MSKVVENYVLQDIIGSGQYGKVYKAQNLDNNEIVAIKSISMSKFREIPKLEEFTNNEIKTLSKMDNPNVVQFLEMLKTQNNVYLIYEYCNGGTLEDLLVKKVFLDEIEALYIFKQLINAFKVLINENILHRDIKPSNILLKNGVVKVGDFGFCKLLKGPYDMTQTMVGSPIYMAPEILKGNLYGTKSDIWSLGIVLYEMLFGYCPYEEQTITKLLNLVENSSLMIPRYINNISLQTEDILRKLIEPDPFYRSEWKELFELDLNLDKISTNQNSPTITYLYSYLPLSTTSIHVNINFKKDIESILLNDYKDPYILLDQVTAERDKCVLIIKLFNNILEASSNHYSGLLAFLQAKRVKIKYGILRKTLSQQLQMGKIFQNIQDEVEAREDFKQLLEIVSREYEEITVLVETLRHEIKKVKEQSHAIFQDQVFQQEIQSDMCKEVFYKSVCLSYVDDIKYKQILRNNVRFNDNLRHILLHSHFILDSLLFDLIEDLVVDSVKDVLFNSEEYFLEYLKKLTDENLLRSLEDKLKFIKINLNIL